MTKLPITHSHKLQDAISQWVGFICKKAITTILLATIVTMALAYYAITNISISTDTSEMLSPDLPFRQNSIALSKAFPQFSDNIVAVIDGPNIDLVNEAADLIAAKLRLQPKLYGDVFDPAGLAFFHQNGLLYLSESELADLSDRLIEAQPFLGTLWKKPTLPGLFDLLSLFLKEGANAQELLGAARPMIDSLSAVIMAQTNKQPTRLSWRNILAGENDDQPPERETRILVIQPKTDFGSLQPGQEAINSLRNIGQGLKLDENFQAKLRLTGSVPLADEELKSVENGLGLAGVLSLTLVILLLFWGLRSTRLVLATLITLLFGLVWTAGFATFAVGTLNLISVAFAVLFIGLSVDFGIHYALRYLNSERLPNALPVAARNVGGALSLSAVAAAIGFFSFLPTDYVGLAELGLIAGGGMFIALFANLTLLPTLISLMPPPTKTESKPGLSSFDFSRHHRLILGGTVILTVASLFLTPKVLFDFDPLNLKDTKTESVSTFFDLMASGNGNPYSITVLAEDLASADKIAARAKKLPLVEEVITLSDLVPSSQDDKLALIENLALILGPAFSGSPASAVSTKKKRLQATTKLQAEIKKFSALKSGGPLFAAVQKFGISLNKLLSTGNPDLTLKELEQRLLASLPKQLVRLKQSLNAEPISLKDLPKPLSTRQISADGRVKVEIKPKGNMRNRDELAAFVEAVRLIAPAATGTPVVIFEGGKAVVQAFIEAAILTVILIVVLVIFLTKGVREIVLIFAPLFLAALFTLAASVILNLPFNFANVIVLPLLFGLGIAGSIHLVIRDRESVGDVMATSTPRAIIFSALTTIGSFGSIALSSHPGTSSMGVLLTIAITLSLICTLIILPALLASWPKAGAR
ncbi:MAG: MMPL family transporter [Rhodospirillaceae bacterium]|nr:MMPL family transporter [Rhodospirillaceae bacterium]MBT4938392.1 MMPL family transporter [Rhodospirillaceae bacterium]MBT5941401.1 MMPL family transporter [Rhodospirillaceae bacterium]